MEITYTILGADGAQYGPIPLAQLKIWIREGRITPETKVLRSDTNNWLPAAQYPELELAAVRPIMTPPAGLPVIPPPNTSGLEKQISSGSGWFFWIAGLSLINTFINMGGGGIQFAIGLGITQLVDVMIAKSGSVASIVGTAISVAIAGVFIFLGVCARKRNTWSFVVGLVLYALDGLLLLLVSLMVGSGGLILSLIFHGFALFSIFMGMRANTQLKALERGVVPVIR